MPLPPIPGDINAAAPALRSEFINYIETLIDAAEPVTVTGGGNDLFLGNNTANIINGQSGNDVLAGFDGNDNINGSFGDDYILAGTGDDVVTGGDGNDFLFGEAGIDRMNGDAGDDAMFGGDGNDLINGGEGNDWLYGNNGNDRITDGFGDDLLDGGSGNDRLTASSGNDELRGGAGIDILAGGEDNDFIEGGAGSDRLSGGIGDDVYYYASRSHGNDIIMDFESASDRFEFSGLGFNVDPGTNLNNGTTFIANAAPVAVAFEATVLYETDTGRLYFDVDGAGAAAAQLIATIQGAPPVTEQDFIFV